MGWRRHGLPDPAARMFHPLVTPRTAPVCTARASVAFLLISFIHVVIGEVVPKNLAIEKADRVALLMAPPLVVFLRISAPFVFVIDRSAAVLSRALGLRGGHSGGGHSRGRAEVHRRIEPDEGHLEDFEEDAIQKLLGLQGPVRARDHDAAHRHRLGTGRRHAGRIAANHAWSTSIRGFRCMKGNPSTSSASCTIRT
jgi:hypothetical protein